ncbi:hypothetical protein CCHR01_16329 [Colletotrichum chrysophilum]|uniref:Uncharacterized protein n=1 Tax=Colletotrichum chrysophilum TaxID=1836956 RepID=A0AAD9EAK3_9PEZI|nr:hypothetical protein CCHR01_16329 [Colletotrichum chrysophilum]
MLAPAMCCLRLDVASMFRRLVVASALLLSAPLPSLLCFLSVSIAVSSPPRSMVITTTITTTIRTADEKNVPCLHPFFAAGLGGKRVRRRRRTKKKKNPDQQRESPMEHPRNVLKLLLSAFQPVSTMPAFKGCPVTGHTIPYHNHLHTRPSSYFTFARERRGSAAVRLTSPRRKDRWSDLLGIATVHGSIDSNRRPAHIPDRPCLVVRPPGTDIESAPSIILVAIPLRATSSPSTPVIRCGGPVRRCSGRSHQPPSESIRLPPSTPCC